MTCYNRAFMPRGRHHFSAPRPLIMHRRVARLLILFYSSLVSGPVILSAAGAKDLLFVSAAPRPVIPSAAPRPVILSAAGAKDLLSAVPDARPDSSTVARVPSLTAGPWLARVPPHARSVRKQVLRSRAYRALAQDDNAARLRKR